MLLRPHEDQTGKAMSIVMSAFASLAVLMMIVDTGSMLNTLLPPFKTEPVRLISLFTPEIEKPDNGKKQQNPPKNKQNESPSQPANVQASVEPLAPSSVPKAVEPTNAALTTATIQTVPAVKAAGIAGLGVGEIGNQPPLFGLHPSDGKGKEDAVGNGTGSGGKIFGDNPNGEFSPVETMPSLDMANLMSQIQYPELARRARIQGMVYIRVLVGADGSVEQVKILQSDHMYLEAEALRAARNAKFTPGQQNGEAVRVWVVIPVSFKL